MVEVAHRHGDRAVAYRLRQRRTQRVIGIHRKDRDAARAGSTGLVREGDVEELALRIDRDCGGRIARGVGILRGQRAVALDRELLHIVAALVHHVDELAGGVGDKPHRVVACSHRRANLGQRAGLEVDRVLVDHAGRLLGRRHVDVPDDVVQAA